MGLPEEYTKMHTILDQYGVNRSNMVTGGVSPAAEMTFRTFSNIFDHMRTFPNKSEHFRTFPTIVKYFRTFPNLSEQILAFPNISEHMQTIPSMAEHFRTPLELNKWQM